MTEHNMPVFIKIDEYKDIMDVIKVLKEKVKQTQDLLHEVHKLKEDEESELSSWSKNLSEVGNKLEFIDNMIFEPKF